MKSWAPQDIPRDEFESFAFHNNITHYLFFWNSCYVDVLQGFSCTETLAPSVATAGVFTNHRLLTTKRSWWRDLPPTSAPITASPDLVRGVSWRVYLAFSPLNLWAQQVKNKKERKKLAPLGGWCELNKKSLRKAKVGKTKQGNFMKKINKKLFSGR